MTLTSILPSYLFSFMFWLGISLGSLVVSLVSYLVGGHWGIVIRRIAQAGAKTIWLMALFFIPILLGLASLYPWADPAKAAASEVIQHKSLYLNVPFFIIRAAIYFLIWLVLVWRVSTVYNRQAHNVPSELNAYHRGLASFGIILYFLTMTFASIDWILSLEPQWSSTAFGVVQVTAQALAGMSFSIVVLSFLSRQRPLRDLVQLTYAGSSYFRDLGALLLTSIVLWAYVFFFEFLITWAANIPREIAWYIHRTQGGWGTVMAAVFLIQFGLPFIFLITAWAKRNGRMLTILAWIILVANLLYYFWLITPTFRNTGFSLQIWDFIIPPVMGIIWLAVFAFHLARTPALEDREPASAVPQEQQKSIAAS